MKANRVEVYRLTQLKNIPVGELVSRGFDLSKVKVGSRALYAWVADEEPTVLSLAKFNRMLPCVVTVAVPMVKDILIMKATSAVMPRLHATRSFTEVYLVPKEYQKEG